jgi:hypothetical protein
MQGLALRSPVGCTQAVQPAASQCTSLDGCKVVSICPQHQLHNLLGCRSASRRSRQHKQHRTAQRGSLASAAALQQALWTPPMKASGWTPLSQSTSHFVHSSCSAEMLPGCLDYITRVPAWSKTRAIATQLQPAGHFGCLTDTTWTYSTCGDCRRSDMYQADVALAPQAFYNTTHGSTEVNAFGVPFGFFRLPLQGAHLAPTDLGHGC